MILNSRSKKSVQILQRREELCLRWGVLVKISGSAKALILFLAMGYMAVATSEAFAGQPTAPTPAGSPGTWIHPEDYPDGPLSGATSIMLTVGPDGLPGQCKVTHSSGSDVLDQKTCDLIMARAKFNPATDEHGHPVAGSYHTKVVWMESLDPRLPQPGNAEVVLTVEADGSVSNCRMIKAEGVVPNFMPQDCKDGYQLHFQPYVDDKGNPVPRKVTWRTSVTVEPVTAP